MPSDDSTCPLCQSVGARIRGTARRADLVDRYRAIGVNVESELPAVDVIELRRCGKCDLEFFHPMAAGSEDLYRQLQVFDWYYEPEKPEFSIALRLIPDGASVLEVGSGAGAFAARLPARCRYVGLELNASAAAQAQAAGLDVRVETLDQHLAEPGRRYDVVCSFQVLEHVSDPRGFLAACGRGVGNSGRVLIGVPAADSFARSLPDFILDMPPHHVTRWSDRCLSEAAQHSGLEFVRLLPESLRPVHAAAFWTAKQLRLAYACVGRAPPLMATAPATRLLLKVAGLVGAAIARLRPMPSRHRGIAVVAVYRKAAAP